jgi:hypothetical protein
MVTAAHPGPRESEDPGDGHQRCLGGVTGRRQVGSALRRRWWSAATRPARCAGEGTLMPMASSRLSTIRAQRLSRLTTTSSTEARSPRGSVDRTVEDREIRAWMKTVWGWSYRRG